MFTASRFMCFFFSFVFEFFYLKFIFARRNCKITAKPQLINSLRTLTTYIIVLFFVSHRV